MFTSNISTITITYIVGSTIDIETIYWDGITYTLLAFLAEEETTISDVSFNEGELGIIMHSDYYPTDIDYSIDNEGNLIVQGNSDIENYSIDTDGNLIYEE